jgi:hypothetical protein
MSVQYSGDAATTRTSLGLGDAATKTTGTASGNIPVLDGSGQIASGVLSNAAVADNAITLAKMAHGTDGELITYDATGAPANVAVGTSGHVLTSGGAGVAPTFQAAAGGGKVLQVVNVQDGTLLTGTNTVPYDDTKPQNTEGFEVITLAITPTSATSKLIINVQTNYQTTVNVLTTFSLFQDSTADSLATNSTIDEADGDDTLSINYYMTSGTTSATTFKARLGGHATSTFTVNGRDGNRKFGGVFYSSITITEIEA